MTFETNKKYQKKKKIYQKEVISDKKEK